MKSNDMTSIFFFYFIRSTGWCLKLLSGIIFCNLRISWRPRRWPVGSSERDKRQAFALKFFFVLDIFFSFQGINKCQHFF
uniref:Uncharacterized protein n=1 Tax=Nelumbo nucifera TaxID=4432 RepID=A0A822Y3V8_NELNU|nr:TPA_asm: hypothetical protein HUJ06_027374 [Nelumbo nucifera]